MPDFSTLSRHQTTLKVNIPCRNSDGPLHLPGDIEPVSGVILGNVIHAGNEMNPARQAAMAGGVPSRCRR